VTYLLITREVPRIGGRGGAKLSQLNMTGQTLWQTLINSERLAQCEEIFIWIESPEETRKTRKDDCIARLKNKVEDDHHRSPAPDYPVSSHR
jgi:hypothetical protein